MLREEGGVKRKVGETESENERDGDTRENRKSESWGPL